ncbi:glycosyltransferase family 4 protein [Lacibacter sp. H407]|uniref:glycosyltransferase family 4 protein n=1 Tax=Lacibacter sp. H407 TaxID=3133423 RepID=UPI0030BB2748
MHILLVTYEFPPAMATGGIGSYMNHLANLLYRKGHKVSVISATYYHNKESIVQREFCINYLVPVADPNQFRARALAVFEQYFNAHEVDLMESPEVGACGLDIKLKYPFIPLLVKMHTPGVLITKVSNTYQPFLTKLRFVAGAFLRGRIDFGYWNKTDSNKHQNPEYIICTQADLILTPSKALRDWGISYWKLPQEKIKLLANPFTADSELFQFPIDRETKTICFVGKLTILKGMFTFTPALKIILEQHPDYSAIIIGRDESVSEEMPSMKGWMQQELRTVAKRVRFTGALTGAQVKQELAKSDIAVVPSLWENYPTVVLEAMAAGCAVAASDRGGIPEIIKDRQTGLLFEPKHVSSIVNSINELITNKVFRLQIATAGRKKIQNMNNELFILETESIYRSVMKIPVP